MKDIEIKATLNALEGRIHQLEQKIEQMIGVGDMVEAEWHFYDEVYDEVYETRIVEIKRIMKRGEQDVN